MPESRNPMLRNKVLARAVGETTATDQMTVSGTINKTGLLFLILVAGGSYGWHLVDTHAGTGIMLAGAIIGFILAIMISFWPAMSPILAPAYALVEGVSLGYISAYYDIAYPGIAGNAMILTFGTLGLMLLAYRVGLLRATETFRKVIMIATFSIMVTYLVDMVMGFFGRNIHMIHEASPVGIAFSLIVTAVAAFNLILDFDLIQEAAARRMPKYMEWYSGFALMVTLVWLYLEMLRLLSKVNRRR